MNNKIGNKRKEHNIQSKQGLKELGKKIKARRWRTKEVQEETENNLKFFKGKPEEQNFKNADELAED